MKELVCAHAPPEYSRTRNSFQTLVRAIVGQQLSGKAARTIYDRFAKLSGRVNPATVSQISTADLRAVGLSRSKAEFLHCLASAYLEGTINPRRFARMSDDALRTSLTHVKGLGIWTVDMFLIFGLLREDVLPTGDLGIRKGMQRVFDLSDLPKASRMTELAAPWQPYRSVACHYLWHAVDG